MLLGWYLGAPSYAGESKHVDRKAKDAQLKSKVLVGRILRDEQQFGIASVTNVLQRPRPTHQTIDARVCVCVVSWDEKRNASLSRCMFPGF